jgi:dihydrofolate reductase / thymidylate synthase
VIDHGGNREPRRAPLQRRRKLVDCQSHETKPNALFLCCVLEVERVRPSSIKPSNKTKAMMITKDMAATAVVAASASTRGIGWKGELPWKLPGDMKHFKDLTMGTGGSSTGISNSAYGVMVPVKTNAVVMGRNTWESIPTKFRPLEGRTNVVLSKSLTRDALSLPSNVLLATSLADAWHQLAQLGDGLGEIFVIGGSQIYQQAIEEKYVHKIVYTQVDAPSSMQFDTFFPELPCEEWSLQEQATRNVSKQGKENNENGTESNDQTDAKSGLTYRFLTYRRPNHEEEQYLNLIRDILKTGSVKGDRTGTGTISKFGAQMRFDLRNGQLPLLTTKKTFWRGVAEELLWFVRGSTNAKLLQDKKIHIWDGNASREFLDQRGLAHREVGDLGPVYGFQWRHFGAKYVDMHTDYTGQGVDQLQDCIDKIIHNPNDRRIVMSAWNPSDLDDMALPPCHLFCQFYVDTNTNEVSCQMYQRSADMGLGVPFNIASYALLTHMVAHVTGRKPGELIHVLGDAHVYQNHVEPLHEQLQRTPRPFPKLYINPDKTTIDDFDYSDFTVMGYHPLKTIAMKMAV